MSYEDTFNQLINPGDSGAATESDTAQPASTQPDRALAEPRRVEAALPRAPLAPIPTEVGRAALGVERPLTSLADVVSFTTPSADRGPQPPRPSAQPQTTVAPALPPAPAPAPRAPEATAWRETDDFGLADHNDGLTDGTLR